MKVAHLLLDGASHYDRTCESVDRLSDGGPLSESFELGPGGAIIRGNARSLRELGRSLDSDGFALLHVHGSTKVPGPLFASLRIPWLADRRVPMPRSLLRRFPSPAAVLIERDVPEAVREEYFVARQPERLESGQSRIGTFVRSNAVLNNVAQASERIRRFREDVEWIPFEAPPSPQQLSSLDLWVDPAVDDQDLDGMVGEALACGVQVVASRTAPNVSRLDGGKAGLLAPSNDHNELVHAVLNALFKDELAAPFRRHAESIRDRFRPLARRTAVRRVYEDLTR